MDTMHSHKCLPQVLKEMLKHCVIQTDYYQVREEPKIAAQICGKPDSTALTVQQLSHLSSIFDSEMIDTILKMP